MKHHKEIFPITIIITMIAFSIMLFAGNHPLREGVEFAILSTLAILIYLLISFFQNHPKLYNLPPKTPHDKIAEANNITANSIFNVKILSLLLIATFFPSTYFKSIYISIISSGIFCVSLITTIIIYCRQLKSLR